MKRHLRRLAAPRRWKVLRKTNTYIMRPNPGAHTLEQGLALGVLLRDYLGFAQTMAEARQILQSKGVLVDGKKRTSLKYPVGLMDVVSFSANKEHYRMLLSTQGMLVAVKIPEKESMMKPKKIINKTLVRKGMLQLNFFDGTNMLAKEGSYKVGDSALIEFPVTISKSFALAIGCTIYLTGGKHIGEVGIVELMDSQGVRYKTRSGATYVSQKRHVFVVGDKQPCISLGESP